MDELTNLKHLIYTYIIFSLLVLLIGAVSDVGAMLQFPELYFNFSSLGTILVSGLSILNFLGFILIYTTNITVINIFLWGLRLLAIMEVGLYIKRLIHPTTA